MVYRIHLKSDTFQTSVIFGRSSSYFSRYFSPSFLSTSSPLVSLQKFYKEKFNREKGKSSFTNMKTLPEVEHAMEVNKNQSDVNTLSNTHLCSVLGGVKWRMLCNLIVWVPRSTKNNTSPSSDISF